MLISGQSCALLVKMFWAPLFQDSEGIITISEINDI